MDAPLNKVYFPATMFELHSIWSRFPDAILYAGGSSFIYGQDSYYINLPLDLISLEKLEELRRISRTERYLEIGAMVELNEVLRLGKIVPKILR